MTVNYEMLGKRLKQYRENEGKTMEDLAKEIHISKDYVKKIESGSRAPALDILVDTANALNISADMLLTDSLDSPSPENAREFNGLLIDCSNQEREFIIRLVLEVKKIFKEMNLIQ